MVPDGATGRPVAVLDTLRVFRSTQRLGQDAFLTEQLSLRVPAGGLHFAFVIAEEQASAGDALTRMPLDVGRLDRGFAVSDAVLGRAGSGLVWRRGAGDVPLNPLNRFPRDGEITLFYELYGLPQSTSVPTRVSVASAQSRSLLQRIFGGGGGAADLAYSTVTEAEGRASVRQRIALRGLTPGRYTLRLELTDPASGAHVVRVSPFEIEDR